MKLKTFDGSDRRWHTFRNPQLEAAYKEIQSRYCWIRNKGDHKAVSAVENHAAQRAAYIFPSSATSRGQTSKSLEDCDESKNLTTRILAEHGLATLPHSISSFKHCLPRQIALDHLLSDRPAPQLLGRATLLRDSHNASSYDIPPLHQLFSSLRAASSFQREYIARIGTSEQCLRMGSQMTLKALGENHIEILKKHYVQCRVNYLDSLALLKTSLGPTTNPNEQLLNQFGQWPPITADVLLRYLASTSPIDIPPHWKKCLISLALLLLDLQRARRLLRFALDGLEEEFSKELENEGCDGWNPEEYPD